MAARAQPFQGSLAEAVDALGALLGASVGRRMVADVPLGAMLSGGIDSSVVVALMQAQRGDRVRTFSIGSREPGYDEATHAKAVAAHLGTEHTELYVEAADALAVVPLLPTLYDEPFADSSQVPSFLVSSLARRHVTVALTGDAGDELFGGYNRYIHGAPAWRRLRAMPRFMRTAGASLATAVGPATLDRWVARLGRHAPAALAGGRAGDKLHKLAMLLPAGSEEDFHRALLSYWPDPSRVVSSAPPSPASPPLPAGLGFAERAMLHDTLHYLPDDILAKVDRASMGVSLETRVPMLDTAVYGFAWSLPMAMKIDGGTGKRVLRELLYRHVPRELVDRPKQGFAVPVAAWLRGALRDWAEDLLDPVRMRDEGWLQPEAVHACWDEHQSGRRNWDTRLWTVLMFQAWLRGQAA
jgi:asparagine synthase (glutamine-hydrolysing)